MTQTGRKRLQWVDGIKGFAMLCVVLGHVADGYLDSGLYVENQKLLSLIYNSTYAFHMPLYFCISGLLFGKAYTLDNGKTVKKERIVNQILNMIGVYLLFSILMGVFKILAGKFTNTPVSIRDVALIWGKPISPYWYLYTLIVFYFVFSVDRIRNAPARVVLPCLLAMSLLANSGIFPSVLWFQISNIAMFSVFFYAGYLCATAELLQKIKDRIITILGTSTILIGGGLLLRGIAIRRIPMVFILYALVLSLFLIHLFQKVTLLGEFGPLRLIGRYSLEIYVLHCFFTAGLRVVFTKITIESIYINILLNTIISTAIPILFAWACKKFKIHDLFFRPYTFFNGFVTRQARENKHIDK